MRRHAKASPAGSTRPSSAPSFRLLAAFALVIAGLLVLAAPAFAGKVEAGYFAGDGTGPGGSGSADGQLLNPGQADVNDTTGNVYVADTGNNRIEVFKPTATLGEYDSQVTIPEPTGLAVDQDSGDVYVSNAAGISKFTSGLTPITVGWADPAVTGNLAIDPSTGDLLVADTDGNLIRRFESDGTAAGTFVAERPIDVAANSLGEILVVTSTGNITGECGPTSVVKRFSGAGVETGTIGGSLVAPGAVAVDPDDDSIAVAAYVNTYYCEEAVNNHLPIIAAFSSAGGAVETIKLAGSLSEPGVNGNGQFAMIPGLTSVGGGSSRVYIVTKSPAGDIYGATKVAVVAEAAPLVVPVAAHALAGGRKALLGGKVNPRNQSTDYWLEYGPTSSYGNSIPASHDSDAGSGNEYAYFTQEVSGLSPETTYHFRIVAHNATGTTPGSDGTFTTTGPPLGPESCPNEAVRSLQLSKAADCRAWEMVSPLEKKFNDAGTSEWFPTPVPSAPDGNSAVYFSNASYAGAESSFPGLAYMAKRGPDGWVNEGISPPVDVSASIGTKATMSRFISADLSKVLFRTPARLTVNAPLGPKGASRLYIRNNATGTYQLVSVGTPTNEPEYGSPAPEAVAVTPDYEHVLFTSYFAFTPDATTAEPQNNGSPNLYQWNAAEPEELELVGYLPNESVESGGAAVGGKDKSNQGSLDHAMSDDGSRVFFTSPPAPQNGRGTLYVRENGISTSKIAEDARFWSATPDGSKVLFTDADGIELYDLASETTTNISPDNAPEDGTDPDVGGIVQKSEDLTRVYFTSGRALVPGMDIPTGPGGQLQNLYLSENGVVSYIGALNPLEEPTWGLGAGDGFPYSSTEENQSAVTADGDRLAFVSSARMGAYDNEGNGEVYLYDASDKQLSCVSCPGTSTAPQGHGLLMPTVAGRLVGFVTAIVDRHNFSADGSRLIFETSEALSSDDTNGASDIYEWSDGRTRLITPGTGDSPRGYLFGGASPSGNSIFFGTRNQVVAEDTDRINDLYVARIDGGIMAQNMTTSATTPCEGEQCRGASSDVPGPMSQASREVRGSRNATPEKRKQAKHHKKKHRKHKQKRKHHKKKHKASHQTQRNG